MHKTTGHVWDPQRLVILDRKTLLYMQKLQVRHLTHRDLKFWSKMRCFACKYHRWGLGHIETSYSGVNHDVVHAQTNKSCLGPIETCYSRPEVAVLHAKTTGGVLHPQRLVILVLKSLFCMYKTTGEGWNQYRLFIVVLSSQLCVLKSTDDVWDQ